MSEKPAGCRRRQLLEAGGAALGTAISAATAGCAGILPPLGTDLDFGRVDPPTSDAPTYRTWLPEPSAFPGIPDDDPPSIYPDVVQPGAFPGGPSGPTVHANYAAPKRCRLDHFGVSWSQYRTVVDYFGWHSLDGSVFLIDADFDPTTVARTLTDTGYEHASPIDGFETFERSDPDRVVAVGDSKLVFATESHPRERVRTVIDTGRGRVPRYHTVDDGFQTLSERAGMAASTTCSVPNYDTAEELDPELKMESMRPTSNAVYLVTTLAFSDGKTPSTKQLKRAYAPVASRESVSVQVGVEDTVAVVEERHTRRSFLKAEQMKDGGRIRWPQVTWSVAFDRDAETVTFTHRGGDDVKAANTEAVRYQDGVDVERDRQFADTTDTIAPGDSLTVDVSDRNAGDVVALGYFVYGIGGRNMVSYQFGGAQ